jgi:hypothetical protein
LSAGLLIRRWRTSASRPSHVPLAAGSSETAVAPPQLTITHDSHRHATLLVTAVDELFGTHRRRTIYFSCTRAAIGSPSITDDFPPTIKITKLRIRCGWVSFGVPSPNGERKTANPTAGVNGPAPTITAEKSDRHTEGKKCSPPTPNIPTALWSTMRSSTRSGPRPPKSQMAGMRWA